MTSRHITSASDTVVLMLTTREAAERLNVNQARVRALIASGTLAAQRFGTQWLLDEESVDRQAALTSAGANGRPMSTAIAWAAGDLADGGQAAWIGASDRSRLRRRLDAVTNVAVVRKWLRSRSEGVTRFRIGEGDIDDLLGAEDVVATGLSAADAYGLGLGTGGSAHAYVSQDIADRLEREFFLIRSAIGNLTLRVTTDELHLQSSRQVGDRLFASRLVVGVDLADDLDARTQSAGRGLIGGVLAERRWRAAQ